MESAVVYLVALAVPVWLVVEELATGERRRVARTERRASMAARPAVSASRAAW